MPGEVQSKAVERGGNGHMTSGGYGALCFEAGPEPGVYTLELDLALACGLRARWPYLKDIEDVADFNGDSVAFKSE